MVFGFGIGVAVERGQKVDLLMRATPLPPVIAILAKVLNALFYALLSLVILIVYAVVVGGIRQDLTVWLDMIARLLAGSVPFIGLGFSIGYLCGPNVAPAVANLVYLPLTFASGLFMPLSQLPGFVRVIAPYLPAYHYGQLGWSALGANTEPLPVSLAWLAGYTLLFLLIAIRAYRKEESRKFG
jgi:ABC-2 type transport system permease protein